MLVVLGQILLWLGLIGAALTTVFRLDNPPRWQTITWSTYALWLSVGWIALLLRSSHGSAEVVRQHRRGSGDHHRATAAVLGGARWAVDQAT